MEVMLKDFLERHSRILPGPQCRYLLLYIVFGVRLCKKLRIPPAQCSPLAGVLTRNLSGISGYRRKDAFGALEQLVNWDVLDKNHDVYVAAERVFRYLYDNRDASSKWLKDTVEEILGYENGGEIVFTPSPIRRLISLLASQKPADVIFDVCCGSFLLGLDVWDKMENKTEVACRGEDINAFMCTISMLMLFLCDISDFSVTEENIFKSKLNLHLTGNRRKIFVGDLPMVGTGTLPVSYDDEIFSYIKSTLYADWTIIHRILSHMESTDRAFLVVTKGALVRENERPVRELLIKKDWIDAVISLPMGLYPGDTLPMELLVLQKDRDCSRRGKVFMADLSDCTDFNFDSSEDRILKVAEKFNEFSANYDKLIRIVHAEEIKRYEYSLFPQFYLSQENVLEGELHIADVAEVTRGIQDLQRYQYFIGSDRYLLNVRDLQDGRIDYSQAEIFNKNHELWERKYLIREDDIILTARGASLKAAIVPPGPKPAYISGNLLIIRVDPEKYPPYVLYEYLISEEGQEALNLIHTGTTIRVLGNKKLEQLAIPAYDKAAANELGKRLKSAEIKRMRILNEIEEQFVSEKQTILTELNNIKK